MQKSKLYQPNFYIISNIIYAGVLVAVVAYFGFFSSHEAYPISAVTSLPLTSTGLQRALSEWVRFNSAEAMQYNKYSLAIFLFIVIQLVMRIVTTIVIYTKPKYQKTTLIFDVTISVLLFLWAFVPLTYNQFFG